MAKKRVMAHFMHEPELAAANQWLEDRVNTECYVIGTIDEENIPLLEAQGLIVQEVTQGGAPETPGAAFETLPGVNRPGVLSAWEEVKSYGDSIDEDKPNYYLIEIDGPLLEDWKAQLAELGVEMLEYIPHCCYTVRMDPEQAKEVGALSFVKLVRVYTNEDTRPGTAYRAMGTLSDETETLSGPQPLKTRNMQVYDLRLHRAEDLSAVLERLNEINVDIAGASGRKVRIYLLEDDSREFEIVSMPEVADMQVFVPPVLHNDVARALMGVSPGPNGNPPVGVPYTGDGQIVGVADTGLDDSHPDFRGRIVGLVALGRPNDPSDPHGHGTHVAGSILGSGASSRGKLRGVAPKAKLFFQSLLDSRGGLGGLPLDLGALFDEAYQAGARIHNNSWGAATQSMYTFNSSEVDEFVATHRDMLIVISAGNEGSASQRLHSPAGFVDWLSIGSPASSKNALTVGASRSNRTKGGFSNLTYGDAWPHDFPDSPIRDERISGDAESLAAFSSRGPCDDRRVKPEVVAPGTDIASTKSSQAPIRNFWGPYPRNRRYAFMGGTSMSAPLVAGCAALVREYYVKERNHQPSAALLKATLINGTRSLGGADAVADYTFFHQGYGGIYLPTTLPNAAFPAMKLEFVDTWQTPAMLFNRTGQRLRYRFSLSGGQELRITLAYTDLPARGLQNNLNLFVQHVQSGQKWMGNQDMPLSLKIPDPDNNVEVVRLEQPPAGDYLIQISAINLLQTGQDFAVVVTGDLTSELIPF